MGIIGWILLGLIAGAIAKLILPGDDPGGFIVTTLIGIAGALLGGFIASALDIGDLDEFFDIGTWLIAIGGSLLLLLLYRAFTGGTTARGDLGRTRRTKAPGQPLGRGRMLAVRARECGAFERPGLAPAPQPAARAASPPRLRC